MLAKNNMFILNNNFNDLNMKIEKQWRKSENIVNEIELPFYNIRQRLTH